MLDLDSSTGCRTSGILQFVWLPLEDTVGLDNYPRRRATRRSKENHGPLAADVLACQEAAHRLSLLTAPTLAYLVGYRTSSVLTRSFGPCFYTLHVFVLLV